MALSLRVTPSPLGPLRLLADGDVIIGVYLPAQPGPASLAEAAPNGDSPVLDQLERELREYFLGERTRFEVPMQAGGTPWQRDVWQALCAISSGHTTSYAAIARALGRPTATRAVGAAIGRNPLSIIVPCHRVVASDGRLTGYAGGLAAKQHLLDHERAAVA
jgi:methylated-DNA-[protein]-cysteine S-methyltransferase